MSIKLLVTFGFGNGTFDGSIGDIVTSGYSFGSIWTVKEKVSTTWTDTNLVANVLQGGSMVGFIISSNSTWTNSTKVTTTWTNINGT